MSVKAFAATALKAVTRIITFPWNVVMRFGAAYNWVRAERLSSHGRHEEALRLVRKLPEAMKQRNDCKLFEIQLLCLLEWDVEAIDAVNRFLTHLAFKPIETENRRYILAYARWCGRASFSRIAEEGVDFPSAFVAADDDKIKLALVSSHLKRHFPFVIHAKWAAQRP